MQLEEQEISVLFKAIRDYDYPPELYDFEKNKRIQFKGMRELEGYLREGLLSNAPQTVKNALANIVYWGNVRSGYCLTRTKKFLNGVTETELKNASHLFAQIEGDSLKEIKEIGLPQFSNMSFVSKLRMFLDPENYVTLDRKLIKMKQSKIRTLFNDISEQPTYLPINDNNCRKYVIWSQKCKNAANTYFIEKRLIAVDVERGIFQLVNENKVDEAAAIVSKI